MVTKNAMDHVAKASDFPLKHIATSELKNTEQIAEQVKESDIILTHNGETVAYLVNPTHYEALVNHWNQTNSSTLGERFLRGYAETHGSLEKLDIAYAAAERGEWASDDEVTDVFGE